MMLNETFTRIGEEFGVQIAGLVSSAKTRSVTIESVDDATGMAMCYIFEEDDEKLPVPITFLAMEQGMLKVTPTVGSLAAVAFLNGDENRPYFVTFSSVDKIEFLRSSSSITWTVDPEDATKDALSAQLGDVKLDVTKEDVMLNVADASTVHLTKDVIELNGGGLNGLVVVGKLTERLNKLQDEIDKIQQAITSHTHTYIDSKGAAATPTPSVTTGTTYSTVPLTPVQDSDYINNKITQG